MFTKAENMAEKYENILPLRATFNIAANVPDEQRSCRTLNIIQKRIKVNKRDLSKSPRSVSTERKTKRFTQNFPKNIANRNFERSKHHLFSRFN